MTRLASRPKLTALLAGTVLACLAGSALSVAGYPAPEASARAAGVVVGLLPREMAVDVGETTTVQIQVRDAVALYGADVHVAFDPTYLEVVDSDPTVPGVQITILPDFLAPDLVLRNVAENTDGTVWYAVTQVNPTLPVTGTGSLADITFRGLVAGTSPITVTYQMLVRRDGTTIDSSAENGRMTVTIPGHTVTPGPSPTRGPTAVRSATPTDTAEPGVTVPAPSGTASATQVATITAEPTWTPAETTEPGVTVPATTGTASATRVATITAEPTWTPTRSGSGTPTPTRIPTDQPPIAAAIYAPYLSKSR